MKIVNGHRVNEVLITTNDNILSVSVSVEPFSETEIEIRITTKDLLNYLNHVKNIPAYLENCIKSSVISNRSENSLFGTWEFILPNFNDSGVPLIENIENSEYDFTKSSEIKPKKIKKINKKAE